MNKTTLLTIANLLSGFAAHAKSMADAAPEDAEPVLDPPGSTPTPAEPAPKKTRGRAATPPVEPEKPKGYSVEELRAKIEPLVKGGQGADVKKLIAEHGGGVLADIPPENHDAFLKDIEALTF